MTLEEFRVNVVLCNGLFEVVVCCRWTQERSGTHAGEGVPWFVKKGGKLRRGV